MIEEAFEAPDPLHDELGYAWELIRRGGRVYLRDPAELDEVIAHLAQGRDYQIEELGFETRGHTLYVSLLDEAEPCDRERLLIALRALRSRCA